MNLRLSSEKIKAEAHNLGFFACGIAKAEPVDAEEAARFTAWLGRKGHAGMDYMAANTDKRLNPQLLMPGVKSIVCVALSYAPASRIPADEPQLAAYALGQDYHYIMKDKLRKLASTLGLTERTDNNTAQAATLPKSDKPCSANATSQSSHAQNLNNPHVTQKQSNHNSQFSILKSQIPSFRAFCDTAPVLERYWAMKAGLGWIGRNHQLIIPHAGSMFFLGELFVDAELEYDTPLPSRCGNCHACTDACPTGALHQTDDSRRTEFCSDRCLSYLTIENRGDIPQEYVCKMGNCIYGCDRCQDACPWNRFAQGTTEEQLRPREELLNMTREKWTSLTVDDYRRLFKGSAVKRAKYDGLMRNIKAALQDNDNNNKDKI